MLTILSLVLSGVALALAAGALAMTHHQKNQQRRQFTPLTERLRRLEETVAALPVRDAARSVAPPAAPEAAPRAAAPAAAPDTPRHVEPPPVQAPTQAPRERPAVPPEEPQAARPEAAAAAVPDESWQRWLEALRALPHGDVAALLGEVLLHSGRLAQGFAEPAARQAFREEVGEGLKQRLTRFQQCARDEATFVARWVEPDLVTALDLLARHQSQAAADARDGHAAAAQLAAWLLAAIYDRLGPACQAEGWFGLDPVEPFRTPFDPQRHKGVDGRPVAGARGLVVALHRVGRLHPTEGWAVEKAQVVVGR